MTSLVWGFLIVALYISVLPWLLRRRRLPALGDLPAGELKRAVPSAVMWSVAAGVFFGFTLWYGVFCLLRGSFWILPAWVPPQAVFLPLMLAQICFALATRPRVQG